MARGVWEIVNDPDPQSPRIRAGFAFGEVLVLPGDDPSGDDEMTTTERLTHLHAPTRPHREPWPTWFSADQLHRLRPLLYAATFTLTGLIFVRSATGSGQTASSLPA